MHRKPRGDFHSRLSLEVSPQERTEEPETFPQVAKELRSQVKPQSPNLETAGSQSHRWGRLPQSGLKEQLNGDAGKLLVGA